MAQFQKQGWREHWVVPSQGMVQCRLKSLLDEESLQDAILAFWVSI